MASLKLKTTATLVETPSAPVAGSVETMVGCASARAKLSSKTNGKNRVRACLKQALKVKPPAIGDRANSRIIMSFKLKFTGSADIHIEKSCAKKSQKSKLVLGPFKRSRRRKEAEFLI
jgi:hypothetical protein